MSILEDQGESVKIYADNYFSLDGEYDIYVHKSLTRKVLVFKKIK